LAAVRFTVEQALPGTVAQVLAAVTDERYLATLGELPTVGEPEVLDRTQEGDLVRQRVRYRFTGDLSPAVTRVVDRDKLVWIDEHAYDLASGRASFRIVPEHYADRLRCGGTERFTATEGGTTTRTVDAELRVRWPVVGGLVERAIASGFQQHLAEEARLVGRFLAEG
jgi:hypothetical protein